MFQSWIWDLCPPAVARATIQGPCAGCCRWRGVMGGVPSSLPLMQVPPSWAAALAEGCAGEQCVLQARHMAAMCRNACVNSQLAEVAWSGVAVELQCSGGRVRVASQACIVWRHSRSPSLCSHPPARPFACVYVRERDGAAGAGCQWLVAMHAAPPCTRSGKMAKAPPFMLWLLSCFRVALPFYARLDLHLRLYDGEGRGRYASILVALSMLLVAAQVEALVARYTRGCLSPMALVRL